MEKTRGATKGTNLVKIRLVTKEQRSHRSKRSTDAGSSENLQKTKKLKDLPPAPAPALGPTPAPEQATALAPARALATAVEPVPAPASTPALARPPAPAAASTPSLKPAPTAAPAPATTPAPLPAPTTALASAPAPAITPAPPSEPTPAPALAPASTLASLPTPLVASAPASAPVSELENPQGVGGGGSGLEKPQGVGPSVSGGGEAEEMRGKRKEDGDAPVEIRATIREMGSSNGVNAANLTTQRNATTEQEALIAELTPAHVGPMFPVPPHGLCVGPYTSELQKVKLIEEELDRRRGFTAQLKKKMEEDMERSRRRFEEKVEEEKGKYQQEQMQLKIKMEEEMERIRRRLDEKVQEEEGRYQQEQMQLVDIYQKMLQVDKLANEMWDKFIQQTGLTASASSSSQVTKHRPQLGSQPRLPQSVWKAVPALAPKKAPVPALSSASASARIPSPTALETAMGTAQTGGHSGSMFRPNNTCSSRSLSIVGPHIVSTSSHHPTAAPSDTVLPHLTTALGAVHRAPEQYHSQPHLSAPLAISTSATVALTSPQRFAPSAGTPLCHPNRALGAAFSASAPHPAFSGPHLSAIPAMSSQWIGSSAGTSIWHSGLAPEAALLAPEPHLPSSQPHPPVGSATSTLGLGFSDSIASWRPRSGGLFPHPAPASGAVLRVPAPHLACPQPYPSANPCTFTPACGSARTQVEPAGHTQIRNNCLDSLLVSSVISGLRSIIPNNGNTNYDAAGTSGDRNDDTGSGGGRRTVNGDGLVWLSDDD